LTQIQAMIFDMKTVRSLSKQGIILTDEPLREAGKRGSEVGKVLRRIYEI